VVGRGVPVGDPSPRTGLAGTVGATGAARDAIARAAAVLLLTMRGTPFLYYGEEIGMGDVDVPQDESIDLPAARVSTDFEWWDQSRSRTPMPWSGGPHGGFSATRPWLRLGDDTTERNVETQWLDPDSVLACYRRLLAARQMTPSLQDGRLRLVPTADPDVLAYGRLGSGPDVLAAIAFGADGGAVRLPRLARGRRWRELVGTHRDLPSIAGSGQSVALRGYEGMVFVAADA